MSSCPALRVLVLSGALLLVLGACGRRGPLEEPPLPGAQQQAPSQGVLPSPVGTVRSRGSREIVPPKKPFILDPLL